MKIKEKGKLAELNLGFESDTQIVLLQKRERLDVDVVGAHLSHLFALVFHFSLSFLSKFCFYFPSLITPNSKPFYNITKLPI